MKKQMTRMYVNAACAAFLAIFTCREGYAQVKVGNNPGTINADAVLEMETADKGILLPRVVLSATNNAAPLSGFTKGMTVYNTATAGSGATAVSEGIYYCDGTQWLRVSKDAEVNLYKDNGTLTGDRTIDLGGHDLILGGLQPQDTAGGGATGTLVVDNSGALRMQTDSTVPAARVKGAISSIANNTITPIDSTSAPVELIDNLGEFSGSYFTAKRDGLYQVSFFPSFYPTTNGINYYGVATCFKMSESETVAHIRTSTAVPSETRSIIIGESGAHVSCPLSTIIRLKAGDRLRFCVITYAAPPVDAHYELSINRLD